MKASKYITIRTPKEEKESFKFFNKQITSRSSNSYLWKYAKGRIVKEEQTLAMGRGVEKKANTRLPSVITVEKKFTGYIFNK